MTLDPLRKGEPKPAVERVLGVGNSVMASEDRAKPQAVVSSLTRLDFSTFYIEAYPGVARALGITLGDRELGSEAADEAMARCYAHWSSVRSYDNPAGWVYRVGLNWGRSLLRRMKRHVSAEHPPPGGEPVITDPEIHRALGDLDIKLRSVVVCRFFFDWSVQETADALDLRPGTVKSRAHRALQLLENKLYHLR